MDGVYDRWQVSIVVECSPYTPITGVQILLFINFFFFFFSLFICFLVVSQKKRRLLSTVVVRLLNTRRPGVQIHSTHIFFLIHNSFIFHFISIIHSTYFIIQPYRSSQAYVKNTFVYILT